MIQSVDHVALLPAYLAATAAVLVLLADLFLHQSTRNRPAVLAGVAAAGVTATGVAAGVVGAGPLRGSFCTQAAELVGGVAAPRSCSYLADRPGAVVAVLFCALALGVVALSLPWLRGSGAGLPAGEYLFLLLCSLTGGVVLGYSRDLLTLLIALETLTLPLYVLVGLRRRVLASMSGAVVFFLVSVVATTVTLLGAALLYALTGALHLDRIALALAQRPEPRELPLTAAAVVLVLVGLAFKVTAAPFHAWAPGAYDGAPVPIAGYLSTASKLGGVIALLYVVVGALRPWLDVVGPVLAVLAVLTMTVGNLVALRQVRMVRLLAWSSVAQAGYILAPLGGFALAAGRGADAVTAAVVGTLTYTIFYVLIELGAFGAVVALRGGADGGPIEWYRGSARTSPWIAGGFALALAGLAGLPPGLAGLFAKVAVVRALLQGSAGWLALAVAVNAVIGLAYYVRVGALLWRPAEPVDPRPKPVLSWPVGLAFGGAVAAAVAVGFAPQLVVDAAAAAAGF